MQNYNTFGAGTSWFLGTNTPEGFYSLFGELTAPGEGKRLYILKGGPGSGKSSLMKKIAAEADRRGLFCERAFCSADPDSLDAVIIPSLGVSVADGTAPHVLEPRYPGAFEKLVDLGAFRADAPLRENAAEIVRLTDENREKHTFATRFLHAAGCAATDLARLAGQSLDGEKLENFALHLCGRELGGAAGGPARPAERRFLSAFTPEGERVFYETAKSLCERRIVLHDDTGLAAARIVEALAERAEAGGMRSVRCPNPLFPALVTEHLFLPELSLGVFTARRERAFDFENAQNVQCARFFEKSGLRAHKNRLRYTQKACREMLEAAAGRMREAKAVHDALESYYIGAMDTAALSQYGEELIREIFGAAA